MRANAKESARCQEQPHSTNAVLSKTKESTSPKAKNRQFGDGNIPLCLRDKGLRQGFVSVIFYEPVSTQGVPA